MWNPLALIQVDVNPGRGQLIVGLPVLGPQLVEIYWYRSINQLMMANIKS